MNPSELDPRLRDLAARYPAKFRPEKAVFGNIHPGNRIFIGTGCGEPQHLVQALIDYVAAHPKASFDAELLQVWSLGLTPYSDEKFRHVFRPNSMFIGNATREAVNRGAADYSPVSLSQVPGLFRRKLVPVDVALIQTSLPDEHGYVSLGISVDIVRAAVEVAGLVIAQVNAEMPRIHGDTFLNVEDVDYLVPFDEPLLEFQGAVSDENAERIVKYVPHHVQTADT